MKTYKFLTLLCLVTLFSCKENKAQNSITHKAVNEKITAIDFKNKIESENVQLIDVRTPKEYKEGHIKNAENIDFYDTNFYTQMNMLNKDKPLYIYCRSGGRSGKAATKLSEAGFSLVYDLKDGFLGWEIAGLPIKK